MTNHDGLTIQWPNYRQAGGVEVSVTTGLGSPLGISGHPSDTTLVNKVVPLAWLRNHLEL